MRNIDSLSEPIVGEKEHLGEQDNTIRDSQLMMETAEDTMNIQQSDASSSSVSAVECHLDNLETQNDSQIPQNSHCDIKSPINNPNAIRINGNHLHNHADRIVRFHRKEEGLSTLDKHHILNGNVEIYAQEVKVEHSKSTDHCSIKTKGSSESFSQPSVKEDSVVLKYTVTILENHDKRRQRSKADYDSDYNAEDEAFI